MDISDTHKTCESETVNRNATDQLEIGQYCGSKSEVGKMFAFDAHKQNCTRKLRVTDHVQNECKKIMEIVYI